MAYIVELHEGCWVAPWSGDPGRTLKIHNARRYAHRSSAKAALTRARKYRPFLEARVIDLAQGDPDEQ